MFTRLSFRAKLLLVLFIPFLALVVIAGAGLSDRFTTLRGQEQYGNLEQPLARLHDLSSALEHEATLNAWYVNGGHNGSIPIADARANTDAAVDAFRGVEGAFAAAGLGDAVVAAREGVDAGLVQLSAERARIERQPVDAVTPPLLLLAITDNLLELGNATAHNLADPAVEASVVGVVALEREQTELAREVAAMLPLLTTGDDSAFPFWLRAIAAEGRHRQEFLGIADAQDVATFTAQLDNTFVPDLLRPTNAAADLPTAFPPPDRWVPPASYVDAYERATQQLDNGITAVNVGIAQRSTAATSSARNDVWVYGGLAVLAMLVTIALTWLVARAVIRPLRTLTDNAREISQVQLPQLVEQLRVGGDVSAMEMTEVKVTSKDEIGELAQAFRDVQWVTVEVAEEQSRLLRKGMGDLFVNLARRNQSLLERQLELLDDLERNENEPAALDSLFKLDHMATRMRRNAESLLVLSGAEQPRQWQQPIALLDVVRAAAAEIADFPRVELVGVDDTLAIAGRAVADLAHLLAELLENATSFSPPDSAVVVSGAPTEAGFVLAVSDQGIGMPPERIAEANRLLEKPPAVGLALSRALGLHVVAALATRHEIGVELRPGAPIGLVALVTLPSSVLEAVGTGPTPAPPLFKPDLGPEGDEVPLGALRVAWRPPDEPPVEEWRREGIAAETDAPPGSTEPPPSSTPPAAVPTSPVSAPTAAPTASQADDGADDWVTEATAPFEPAGADRADRVQDDGAPGGDPLDDLGEPGVLPTRVPGRHLSHLPTVAGDAQPVESDPMRPYRVHELLSRHEQGKRRGRADIDVLVTEDPAPESE
ncbi:MAG: nitrate- and nitrite sensing domain-containing protein [Acidimicrobiia bacterium]